MDLGSIVVHVVQPAVRSLLQPRGTVVRHTAACWPPPVAAAPGTARPQTTASAPMKLLLVAVGTRMPAWVDTGFEDFARRMPARLPLQLVEVRAEPRTTGKTVEAADGRRSGGPHRNRPAGCAAGGSSSTASGAGHQLPGPGRRLENWRSGGDDVAIIIGGPTDSTRPSGTARETVRLSGLTLPTRWCG